MTPGTRKTTACAVAATLVGLLSAGCEDTPKTYGTVCPAAANPTKKVARPRFVRNLSIGNTGWFASPAVLDIDGDGSNEIIAPFYDIAVWDADGNLLSQVETGNHHHGRVYTSAVVADLEGDGTVEVVVAAGDGSVRPTSGWTTS